ncbi:MAG: polysaccharide biosynthesis C-terminal domain-containing protein, partial [Chloroflexi bacterium]|nr:polysaccharide biosynthesis C-terminal domain-containing protein [Chloroflexota bacterium]
AVHHLSLFVDRAFATGLGVGSAAALSYAYHLALVVGQLSGLAVSTALFPHLAEQISRNDGVGARRSLADALRLVWLIALPASAALIVLRTPLIRLLLEHGAFDQAATSAVSTPLVWYTLAVLADALCQPLWRVVYVQRSGWTVLAVNGLQTALRLLFNFVLVPFFGYNGLAMSAVIGLTIQVLVLGWWVHRRLGRYLTNGWPHDIARIILATVASAAASMALTMSLGDVSPLIVLALAGLVSSLTYLVALWWLGGLTIPTQWFCRLAMRLRGAGSL